MVLEATKLLPVLSLQSRYPPIVRASRQVGKVRVRDFFSLLMSISHKDIRCYFYRELKQNCKRNQEHWKIIECHFVVNFVLNFVVTYNLSLQHHHNQVYQPLFIFWVTCSYEKSYSCQRFWCDFGTKIVSDHL